MYLGSINAVHVGVEPDVGVELHAGWGSARARVTDKGSPALSLKVRGYIARASRGDVLSQLTGAESVVICT